MPRPASLYFTPERLHSRAPPASLQNTLAGYNNLLLTWSFGDGTSVTGVAAPTHTYAAYGNYYYCLYVTDTLNQCTDSSCNYIYVDSISSCNIFSYISYQQNSFTGDSVTFSNFIGSATSTTYYVWNFGDNTSLTTTSDTIIHVYPGFGTYYVTLLDTDSVNHCSYRTYEYINVDTCNAGYAVFNAQPQVNTPLTVYFTTDSAAPAGAAYVWNFGDGSQLDTAYYLYQYFYHTAGTYNVCLSVQNPGCAAVQYCDTVTAACNLDATFTYSQISSTTISYFPSIENEYNTDTNLVYLWAFGDGLTSNERYPTHVYTDTGTFTTCLTIIDTLYGCSDSTCNTISYQAWTDTICGNVFNDYNNNGIHDSTEPGIAGVSVYVYLLSTGAELQFTTDSNGNYSGVLPLDASQQGIVIIPGYPTTQLYSLPFVFANANNYYYGYEGLYFYQFTGSNQSQCGFDFGVINGSALIAGTVYGDNNLNGVMDGVESGIPNQTVDITNNQSVVTLSNGMYFAYVDTGTYTVNKDSSGYLSMYPVVPPSITLDVPTFFANDTGNNFGVEIPTGTHDLAVDIVPFTPVVPGNLSLYQVQVTNLTGNTENYTDSLTMDTSLVPDAAYLTYNSYNQATNTSGWWGSINPFGSVASGAYQYVAGAGYDVSPALVYNQDIYSYAGLGISGFNDNNPGNNNDSCHQIVVASFDPNYKQANQAGRTALGYINDGQELKYTIEFQNTGTGNAVNVVVKDVIDRGFDIHSFRYIGSSFPYGDVRISGDTVYFRLSDIMLPPQSLQPAQSVGWVAFSIKPKAGLAPLTALHNTANVYFDRNAPVKTNTTLHTIEGPLGIQNIYDDGELTLGPNPFSSQMYFMLQNMPGSKYNYNVTDVLGRVVTEGSIITGETKTLYRNSLSAGTYIITFFDDNGIVKRAKVVAQ